MFFEKWQTHSPELVKVAGDSIEGGYFSNHYSPEDTRPEVVNWVKMYREKFARQER